MNERIVYEEETVKEEVYEGTLILDGHMSEEEQKKHIFDMMRKDGIDISNEDEYSIGYVGASDDDGISETQSTIFVVSRTYKKQVPYKVTTEDIYSGTYILDGLRKTEEEQRNEIFEMMKNDGVVVDDVSDLVIGYTGADDNDGLSETQSTKFVVQRVKKEKIDQEVENVDANTNIELTDEEKIKKLYDELVSLREKVVKSTSTEEISKLSVRISEVTDSLDELIDNSTKNYGPFEDAISNIDKEIYALEELMNENIATYEKLFEDMKNVVVEQGESLANSTSLSQEESDKLNNEFLDRKNSANDLSLRIRKNIEKQRTELARLYSEREKINSNLVVARALGISANDFIEITDKLNRRDIIESVIESRGLMDIILKSSQDRDSSDKLKLREAREEIFNEVEKVRQINAVDSVLNAIDALYLDDNSASISGKRRVLLIKPDSLETINNNVKSLPEKISRSGESINNYAPSSAPKDMEEVLDKIKSDNIIEEREEVFSGELIIGEEDIYDVILRDHGIDIRNDDNYTIGYEGASDNDGLSETQTTKYVVYKKIKNEKIFDNSKALVPVEEKITTMVPVNEVVSSSSSPVVENTDTIGDSLGEKIPTVEEGKPVDEHEAEPLDSSNNETRGLDDKYVIYNDKESDKLYAKKPVFERFNAEMLGDPVRIGGVLCYEISKDDANYIVGNANNSYSPYIVSQEEAVVTLENSNSNSNLTGSTTDDKSNSNASPLTDSKPEVSHDTKEYVVIKSDDEKDASRGLIDKFVIYRDEENEKLYAKKPVFGRFNLDAIGDPVRIGGVLCYEISEDDANYIIGNANNSYSPYRVVIEDIALNNSNSNSNPNPSPRIDPSNVQSSSPSSVPPSSSTPQSDLREPTAPSQSSHFDNSGDVPSSDSATADDSASKDGIHEEIITLYRDIANDNQVYASIDVLRKFGITPSTQGIEIDGKPCYKISRDTDQIINSIAKMSRDPKIIVKYKNIKLEKETVLPRPHVEEIIDKLTDGLDIRAKDNKRFTASNLKIAKNFKNELRSGNVAYNIVHVVPATVKAGIGLVRKLTGKLLTTKRAKEAMTTIQDRLDNLSEIELEVLFDEYKGSQLKTDMNNQINPLILDRLREYGLSKVASLNEEIRINYTVLFTILGQISAIEEQLNREGISKSERSILETQRSQLINSASENIKAIIEARNKANNLLSSGVHGIEEDFKAVATKLNYVGMRFAKANDFDNELQHRLGNFGRNLNAALSVGNAEAIVQNFMGLESCYYENTEIRGSIVGRRSVGSKYYSPMAEQFDYRDDPFMKDLLTTVAVTSATISAINAARVHQIEDQRLLEDQQAQAASVNSQNDSTMDYVHQTGAEIAGKRDTFREGMEAQSNQDVLTNADVIERATLDSHNWKFGNAYHAADDAGHELYNQFNIDVTNKINSVTSQYASGAITSSEALERMVQISNDAQEVLVDTVGSSLDIIRDYAATHPQFNLKAIEDSMSYIVAHPGAIANMNQAMADVTNLAEGLTSLQATHMAALTSLPSDMASTIVCAASSALLAMNVANSMSQAYGNKKGYGNEITDMMDEYLYGYDRDDDDFEEDIEDENIRQR